MKKVLLYSGGLDSYIGATLLGSEWDLAYFNIGHKYAVNEIETMTSLGLPFKTHSSLALQEQWVEHESGFIPQRNPLLISLAQAVYDADEIALCAVAGELSADKHTRFFTLMSDLLSYTANKSVRVFSPFQKNTKSQIVKKYLEMANPLEPLLNTRSGYSPEKDNCGLCQACFRRWVAFENNDLNSYVEWQIEPVSQMRSLISASGIPRIPPSHYVDFLRNQFDVLRAFIKHRRR